MHHSYVIGIASGLSQAQYAPGVVLGRAESAENRRYSPIAHNKKGRIEFTISAGYVELRCLSA